MTGLAATAAYFLRNSSQKKEEEEENGIKIKMLKWHRIFVLFDKSLFYDKETE